MREWAVAMCNDSECVGYNEDVPIHPPPDVQVPTKFERADNNLLKPSIIKRISIEDKEITLGELKTRYNFEMYTFFHKPCFSKFPPTQVYDSEYKIIGPIELTVFDNNVVYIK